MTHKEKIQWMHDWAKGNHAILSLSGSVGFNRPCVGILCNNVYPDYEWYDDDYERIDHNGEVWLPQNAYHKHPCEAVLGHGEDAEAELYSWLRWFDHFGFVLTTGTYQSHEYNLTARLLNCNQYSRMVCKTGAIQ